MSFPTPSTIGEKYYDSSSGRRWVCSSLSPVIWSVDKEATLLLGSGGLSSSGFSQFGNGIKVSGNVIANRVDISDGGLSVTGGITGTILTSAQPNITSVGVLNGLTLANNSLLSGIVAAPDGITTNHLYASGATFANDIYAPNLVTGFNGITGAVSITSGTNVTITQSGKTITIASSGGIAIVPLATSSVTGVASFRAADFVVSATGSVSLTGTVARTNSFSTQSFSSTVYAPTLLGNTIISESGFEIGSSAFRRLTTGYTLAPSDDGKVIAVNTINPVTVTGGTAVGFTGFSCTILQLGSGQVTVSPSSSVTINSFNLANKLSGQHAAATLLCYARNTFNLSGNIIP